MSQDIKLPLRVTEIEQILPHRYPFLFIDMITEFVDNKYIAGIKNVTANEPFFQGHFPGRPILPGVIMLEALAQLGVMFAKLSTDGVPANRLMVFSGAESVKFRRQVFPGDTMRLEMTSFKRKFVHWKMEGVISVGDERALEAVIMATEVA